MGYVVNRKSDVWSDNVSELYEEEQGAAMGACDRHSMERRWTIIRCAETLEMACAQLYTFLQECELVSMDFPSRGSR